MSAINANAINNWKSGKQWEGESIEGQICFWILVVSLAMCKAFGKTQILQALVSFEMVMNLNWMK